MESQEQKWTISDPDIWELFKNYEGRFGKFVAFCISHDIGLRTLPDLTKRQGETLVVCGRCLGTCFDPNPEFLACSTCEGFGMTWRS